MSKNKENWLKIEIPNAAPWHSKTIDAGSETRWDIADLIIDLSEKAREIGKPITITPIEPEEIKVKIVGFTVSPYYEYTNSENFAEDKKQRKIVWRIGEEVVYEGSSFAITPEIQDKISESKFPLHVSVQATSVTGKESNIDTQYLEL